MELAKIEQLLEAYFEGNTSLQEEANLRAYFSSETIAPHLVSYQPMFTAFESSKQEVSRREVQLPKETKKYNRWWIGVAASAVLVIGVAGFVFQEPAMTSEEKEALAAFEKTKEAFQLLSSNFNDGASALTHVNNFTETKNKILK